MSVTTAACPTGQASLLKLTFAWETRCAENTTHWDLASTLKGIGRWRDRKQEGSIRCTPEQGEGKGVNDENKGVTKDPKELLGDIPDTANALGACLERKEVRAPRDRGCLAFTIRLCARRH